MIRTATPFAHALLALALFFAPGLGARAQPSQADLLREINRDIWIPFAAAYEAHDVEAYIALHRADFIRGEGNRKRVSNLAEYASDMRGFFAREHERGSRFTVGFRFTERLARADLASERGIFEFTMTPKEGARRAFYGKFHTVARKESGAWRLLFDYDSNEGETITVKDYEAASAVDDLSQS